MHWLISLTITASLAQLGMALPYSTPCSGTPTAVATPTATPSESAAATPTPPPPCQPVINPSEDETTDKRFFRYGNAFIVDKDLYTAFEYISENYINHHPGAENGPTFAFNDLSNLWPPTDIDVVRMAFKDDMGWLNYFANGTELVDRYRFEAGCIVEHWDAGEVFPSDSIFA